MIQSLMPRLGRVSLISFPQTFPNLRENQEKILVNMLLHFTFGALLIPYMKIRSLEGYFNAPSVIANFTTPGESHLYGLPLSLCRLLRPLGPFFVL